MSGTGRMALWGRCFPCKREDLHLIPRTQTGTVECNCNPSAGVQSHVDPWGSKAANPANMVSSSQ